jgi:hypothetical protein
LKESENGIDGRHCPRARVYDDVCHPDREQSADGPRSYGAGVPLSVVADMALRKLDKTEWKGLFDHLSTTLMGKRAEIETASLDWGDQIEAEWLPFLGITYDPKDDLIEILLESTKQENLDHLISHPREVYVDAGGSGLRSMAIIDGDGTMQIVNLRDPLMLPPPAQQESRRPDAR